MKTRRLVQSLIALLAMCVPSIAVYAADFHHIHLNVTDTAQAADWYAKYFDCEKTKFMKTMDAVSCGKVYILFAKKPAGFQGSVGSAIDHFGWYFADLEAKMKAFEAGGVKIVQPLKPGGMKQAFIEDPWGTKIELLQNATPGLNHIHLMTMDQEGTLKSYHDMFGGEMSTISIGNNSLPILKFGTLMFMVRKPAEAPAPTSGRSFDHIGFSVADLDAEAKRLKELGAKFTMEPRAIGGSKIAFVEGPSGVLIELIQPAPAQ